MKEAYEGRRITLQQFGDHVVASLLMVPTEAVMQRFREDLLERVQSVGAHGVIIDLSGLDVLDLYEFTELRCILDMCRLMGARTLMVGFSPGVAAALVEMEADIDGLETAMTVEAALARLARDEESEGQPAEEFVSAPDEADEPGIEN